MNHDLRNLLEKDLKFNDIRVQMMANLQLIRSTELLISEKYEEKIKEIEQQKLAVEQEKIEMTKQVEPL